MKTRPSTEYALLGSLMAGPKHGYEIMQFLEEALGDTWRVGTSQLYALLKKLEGKRLLCSTLESQETRPSKRVFSLTPSGKRAFLAWQRRPTRHVRDLRIEFLAKLFFFHRLPIEGAQDLVESQIRVLQGVREKIEKKRSGERDSYNNLVIAFKMRTIEAWLDWLQREAAPFVSTAPSPGPGKGRSLVSEWPNLPPDPRQ
ncbi:MAG: PadR family transcriptional regulator [Deltaproteobacteria bacterium]|nr:PadR family transcriptional regulator [Deltaproteobacteria bacterium]